MKRFLYSLQEYKDLAQHYKMRKIFVSIILLHLFDLCRSHGFLQLPTSRNRFSYEHGKDYDFMGLNAGGPGNVQSKVIDGVYLYPDSVENSEARHGMCGDPKSSYETYNLQKDNYPALTTYQMEAVIDIQVLITAHHMGHFEFYLCDMKHHDKVTQNCLFQHRLQRVAVENDVSPPDEKYPYRYYLEPRNKMTFQTDGYPGYIAKM
jgi:hypothetical protein